jgi:hypothetical protein
VQWRDFTHAVWRFRTVLFVGVSAPFTMAAGLHMGKLIGERLSAVTAHEKLDFETPNFASRIGLPCIFRRPAPSGFGALPETLDVHLGEIIGLSPPFSGIGHAVGRRPRPHGIRSAFTPLSHLISCHFFLQNRLTFSRTWAILKIGSR